MPARSNASAPLKGIMLVLLAVLLFASMDTVGKHLMTKFNVPLVAGVRYGLNLLILSALMLPRYGRSLWKTERTGFVMLRGASLAAATFFSGLALQLMPVGETVAILYLQGFGIMLAAGLFLKERVTAAGWLAAAVGFAGVLLIARPGGALAPLGVFYALICATVSVVYILLSRSLVATETTMAMLFHVAVAGTLLFGALCAINPKTFHFEEHDLLLLFYMGAVSLLAHYLLTSAYRYAPASMLAPFNYFHIAFAVLLGWIVYDHVPDEWSLFGMVMIAVSGSAIALHSHLARIRVVDV